MTPALSHRPRTSAALALALLLLPALAWAAPPRVVLLALGRDPQGAVRKAVEDGLARGGAVELVPPERLLAAAGVASARELGAGPLARGAAAERVSLVVGGAVEGRTLRLRAVDATGQERWTASYPLRGGHLAPATLERAVADVRAAAEAAPVPASAESPAGAPPSAPPPEAPAAAAAPPAAAPAPAARPTPWLRLYLQGTVTWRRYCARPGVRSCAQFEALAPELRRGDTVDFSAASPYLGVALQAEAFPFLDVGPGWRGLGALASVQSGWTDTTVRVRTPGGEVPPVTGRSTDFGLSALAAYRYRFVVGGSAPDLPAWVGLRGGLVTRAFGVAPSAADVLPGTHRVHGALGVEASVPMARRLRVDVLGHLFLGAEPGRALLGGGDVERAEVLDYGESAASHGWSADLGLSGEVWGPLGYAVRLNLTRYQDTFSGAGTLAGWGAGGVAEETFASVLWGLSASF